MNSEKADVKIDRPSILGNPFKDNTREENIQQYKSYLWNCIQVVDELNRLATLSNETKLGCHCKPKDCHGDIVLKAIDYLKSRNGDQELKCPKCNSNNLEVIDSGPHKKLICIDCLAFVKFLKSSEYKTFKQLKEK